MYQEKQLPDGLTATPKVARTQAKMLYKTYGLFRATASKELSRLLIRASRTSWKERQRWHEHHQKVKVFGQPKSVRHKSIISSGCAGAKKGNGLG